MCILRRESSEGRGKSKEGERDLSRYGDLFVALVAQRTLTAV